MKVEDVLSFWNYWDGKQVNHPHKPQEPDKINLDSYTEDQ